jgi:NhaP-type Na+/H+ or K+/H+ antiporter
VLDIALAVIGVLILGASTSHRWIDRLPFTATILALGVGVIVGPRVFGLLEVPPAEQVPLLRDVARLTLAVSLMAVALRYPVSQLRTLGGPVTLLLAVVMPLMALTTAGLGIAILGLSGAVALTLGAALAPTDPVLASSVVTGTPAESTIPLRLRQLLSVESGANDGLALPMVTLAAAIATASTVRGAALASLWDVGGAVVLGVPLGWVTAKLLRGAERHGAVDTSHAATYSLVLGLAALGLGGVARTDGLLLVFIAGLAFNAVLTSAERNAEEDIDDSVHLLLVLPLFTLYGIVLPWDRWAELGWAGVGFAAAVLVLRRLPWVALLRRPLHLRWPGTAWLGWFGPMGVAAIYYLTHLETLGVTEPQVWAAGSLVVAASTLVHGATTSPAVRWFARTRRGREADRGPATADT